MNATASYSILFDETEKPNRYIIKPGTYQFLLRVGEEIVYDGSDGDEYSRIFAKLKKTHQLAEPEELEETTNTFWATFKSDPMLFPKPEPKSEKAGFVGQIKNLFKKLFA